MTVCPACKKENQPHYRFCLQCGAELPRDPAHQPIRIQPVPAPAPQPERCGHCGMRVPSGAARCPHCSAPL